MAFGAHDPDSLDIFAVGERLAADGWYLDRQTRPDSLHATVHAGARPPCPLSWPIWGGLCADPSGRPAPNGAPRPTGRSD